jgi:hypothetical protein
MSKDRYEVDKDHSNSTGKDYWMIWIDDRDIIFFKEETAIKVCNALNIAERFSKVEKKVKELKNALDWFQEE